MVSPAATSNELPARAPRCRPATGIRPQATSWILAASQGRGRLLSSFDSTAP